MIEVRSDLESFAGVAQLVEHQPSKLRVASSNLVSRSISNSLIFYLSFVTNNFMGL